MSREAARRKNQCKKSDNDCIPLLTLMPALFPLCDVKEPEFTVVWPVFLFYFQDWCEGTSYREPINKGRTTKASTVTAVGPEWDDVMGGNCEDREQPGDYLLAAEADKSEESLIILDVGRGEPRVQASRRLTQSEITLMLAIHAYAFGR